MLTSYERSQLCHFIKASKEQREDILKDAKADPMVSGALILAYEAVGRF